MYEDFFGLNRSPFELSPDPFFLFPSEKSKDALASISYAICRRKGFVVMTGEVGTGKTLMLRCLFELWERQQIPFAHFIGPRLSATDFLSYITFELGIEVPEPTKAGLLRALYGFLLAQSEKGLTTVLVIDEAQQVPRSVLEEIRMLTNLETVQQKLVQILLVGQPELDKKLDLVELRSLKQRISVRCRLEPLNEEETCSYIARRLELAGADAQEKRIFPAETIKAIHRYSLGIPRSVNNICDQSLIAAYARKLRIVPVEIVDEVASYFRLQPVRNLEQTEHLSDISRQRAYAVHESAALTPNTFPKRVKTPSSPPVQVAPQLESLFRPDAVDLPKDRNRSASAIRVAETVTTDSQSLAIATAEGNGETGRLGASPVTPHFPSSMPELHGEAQSALETCPTSTPKDLSIRTNLSSLRNGLEKYFHVEWREGFDAGIEFLVGLRVLLGMNLKFIAVTVVFVLIASGMFWLRSGTAGNAAPKPTSIVAQIPRLTRNSNSVPDIRPQGRSVAVATEGRKANKLSESKQRQPSNPAQQSVRDVTSDLQGSLNVNPSEKQEIETVPALEPGAVPLDDNSAHAETPTSSGLASPSPSDSTPHGTPEISEQITQPRPLSSVLPTYPELAQRIRAEGEVVIQTLIDQAGKATDMQVLSGPVVLRQAALDALRRTRYEPGTLKGQPVPVRILVTVRFKL